MVTIYIYMRQNPKTVWDKYMTKNKLLLLFAVVLVVAAVPLVKAQTGTIRIGPEDKQWPVMTESPADFEVWVQGAGDPTYEPNILLVMTEASYSGWLSGNVTVSWTGGGQTNFSKTDFTSVEELSSRVPPTGTTNGASYTVASLKTHINYPLDEPIDGPIYWAMGPFVDEPLTGVPQEFTVTLPSTEPRMLVYALGKTAHSEISELFNNKVPPTIPGFVVPELGTILLAAASFTALGLYVVKRKK